MVSDDVLNHLGQPIGRPVVGWQMPALPSRDAMEGRYCRVEPLDPERHARSLFDANALDADGRNWTYLGYGPFSEFADYEAWVRTSAASTDPFFHAIVDRGTDQAVGVAAFMRITPVTGAIEVGHINFSPHLQRTRAATEAMYLMMRRAFELGYRRYEWKCDSFNAASRAAARRFGFSYEGVFRQALVYKGRNRDTAWFAIIDGEWPSLDAAYRQWLDPANFDRDGRQRRRLGDLTAAALGASQPADPGVSR
jgi:RimJ/RimL family protein N-acetyltransferase